MSGLCTYAGLKIIESIHLTLPPREDWSGVRSPGRARRRRAKGYPQRIRFVCDPNPNALVTADTMFMHPVTAGKFRAELSRAAKAGEFGPLFPAALPLMSVRRPLWLDGMMA